MNVQHRNNDRPAGAASETGDVLRFEGVSFVRDGTAILDSVDWTVRCGEHWVVLGPNGSGKTSLARIAALYEHPSSGTVDVLGQRLGRTDVRALRPRIGFVSAAMADLVRPQLAAADVVMCALHGALEPWWHHYTPEDRERAASLLGLMGVGHRVEHTFGSLSSGERQRVLLARSLMCGPELVIADEPNAGLDLGGREELVDRFDGIAGPGDPPIVLVTHHVEEIPTRFTHLLAVRDGRVLDAGPIEATMSAELLSTCFGVDVRIGRDGERWWARRV